MSPELKRIATLARQDPERQFISIAHLLTREALHQSFKSLRKDASPGVDQVTYQVYQENVRERIEDLHERLKSKRYRAQPLRGIEIPKADGRKRKISIPSLEDKIVQKAAVEVLHAIYEQDFLACSYGGRPGRGQHDALEELRGIICLQGTNYILEADVSGYFDSIVREKLMEMIERRIRDGSFLRLIQKWIHVGVLEEGRLLHTKTGTGQGQVISPVLANVYLHYVLDEWFEKEVKPRLRGKAFEIRYVDDFLICFQNREDAERVRKVLSKRLDKYGLTLHPEKTRLIEFGRTALNKWERRKGRKPATFDFLGFTHIGTRSRRGKFTIHVRTMQSRMRRGLKEVSQWCRKHRHDPVEKQCEQLNRKLRGHYQYYGRRTNSIGIGKFYRGVEKLWKKWLNRRTRGKALTWTEYAKLLKRHPLVRPRIIEPLPSAGSLV